MLLFCYLGDELRNLFFKRDITRGRRYFNITFYLFCKFPVIGQIVFIPKLCCFFKRSKFLRYRLFYFFTIICNIASLTPIMRMTPIMHTNISVAYDSHVEELFALSLISNGPAMLLVTSTSFSEGENHRKSEPEHPRFS